MNIRPFKNRIIVQKIDPSEQTHTSGLVLTSGVNKNARRVLVTASAVTEGDWAVSVGAVVYIGLNSGQDITHNGTDYIIITPEDIMAFEVI